MAIQIGVPPIIPSARPSDETPPRHVAAAEVAPPTHPAHLGMYVGIENHGDEKTCLSNLNLSFDCCFMMIIQPTDFLDALCLHAKKHYSRWNARMI
jgi:hypothetical protein